LRWLSIDFTKCGIESWQVVTVRKAEVLPERIKLLRDPTIQAKYLRIGLVKRELTRAVRTADNPHIVFRVRTNGVPWVETVHINGQQARLEGLAGGFYAAHNRSAYSQPLG
jgi:hypothetical protein